MTIKLKKKQKKRTCDLGPKCLGDETSRGRNGLVPKRLDTVFSLGPKHLDVETSRG